MPPASPGVVARSAAAVLSISLLCVARGEPQTRASNWLIESGDSLQLELIREGGCGGVLRIDAARRAVRWEATPGQPGCDERFEARFDDVGEVDLRPEGGFGVRLGSSPHGLLALVPQPHAARFTRPRGAAVEPAIDEPAAPSDPLVADSRRAVDRIRALLGRPAPPRVALREALYGPAVDTTVEALLETPARFVGKAVHLRSRFQGVPSQDRLPRLQAPAGAGRYQLVDGGRAIAIAPEADLAAFVQSKAESWDGLEVDLAGVFWPGGQSATESSGYVISFWHCAPVDASDVSIGGERTELAPLLARPQASVGKVVQVLGRFRGRNLFGDLPRESSRLGGDWVIKDGPHAVWVMGRAAGSGFELDPGAPESTAAWVELVGTAVAREGRLLLRAQSVALVPPPAGGRVAPARQAVGEGVPPVVIFTLPLEGEAVVPETRLVIQFSKPMDEESLAGRIRLRYAAGAADEVFPIRMRYDDEHRSLVIDPGTALRVGETLEVRLMPGIVDVHGMALEPRSGRPVEGAVDTLRYPVEES